MFAALTLLKCPVLRTPPQEIIDQGMATVIAYLKRLSQGSVACLRTKLMFVGLGGAGKTRYVHFQMICYLYACEKVKIKLNCNSL